jgi:amidohydrolase
MSTGTKESWIGVVTKAVDAAHDELVDIALDLHAHPEVNYEEHYAARLLSGSLERHGFAVERGVGGVETAFRGSLRGGAGDGPTVAILAEYDALPEIGHGCGHNLIAITALGAGLGVQAALESLPGRVIVLGTPAEEGGGGKIRLLEAGAFKGVDVALKTHPGGNRSASYTDVPMGESLSLAMVGYRYVFHGKATHASRFPHEGINALNAVIQFFNGIDAMRQHLKEDVRIHGIITDGGKAPNVVPEFAAANFMLRCRDRNYLKGIVVDRVQHIAEGAALITGSRLEIQPLYPLYENSRPNTTLGKAARINAEAVHMDLDDPLPVRDNNASTDSGNVSQVIPTFNLWFAVSKKPVAGHSKALTEAARSEFALRNALYAAKTLALTSCDLLTRPELLAEAQSEFEARGRYSEE